MKSRMPAGAMDAYGSGTKTAFVSARGYTFLEVIIVMAVSASLFVAVLAMFSGKQATTQFTQSMRDYEARIQQAVSDVASGYYLTGTVNCSPAGPSVSFSGGSVNSPGTNQGCLFLGKILTTDVDQTEVFTIAGRQFIQTDDKVDVKDLNESQPRAVATPGSPVDITETYVHKFGLMIKRVYTIAGDIPIGGFGFISELGGANGTGDPDTGSRGVLLYRLDGASSPNGNGRAANVGLINDTARLIPTTAGIRICFWDGGGTHKGEITVGDAGSQTTTELTIDNGISTVCQNA